MVWTGPSAASEPLPSPEIVVIGMKEAATSATGGVPSPTPAAGPAAPCLAGHPPIGRIDSLLDTIGRTTDGDVRALQGHIARRKTGGRDTARGAALGSHGRPATGIRPARIIGADTICETIGRTRSPRPLDNEAWGDQLAERNLSPGPAAYTSIRLCRETDAWDFTECGWRHPPGI